ncbi:MAG: leucine-rich repeat protein [Lachnospiraceae bacterium]|nr:leucine-rich repeat protein [Lachnospiraceae bacterium]
MSKKASANSVNGAKKSKRRLKRSVRRSIAALLMATAIGVAAIPVPDNYAADPSVPEAGDSGRASTGGKQDEHDNLVFDETKIKSPDPSDYINDDNAPALDTYEGKSIDDLIKAINDPTKKVYPSYTLTKVGDTYDLSWQFVYYVVGVGASPRAVICKYNNEYMTPEAELNMAPVTKYYTLETAKVISWYKGETAGMAGMNRNWNPKTHIITYSYDDYDRGMELTDFEEDERYFIENYDLTVFNNTVSKFAAYKEKLEKEDPNPGVKPDPYSVAPSDVLLQSEEMVTNTMLEYYNHYDLTFSDKPGFSWVQVIDDRIDTNNEGGNRKMVLVAQHSSGSLQADTDSNGFLIDGNEGRAVNICAIGNGAFKGAGKVSSLTIPDQIGYIGDEAFMEATLITTINVGNVEHLGNSAFKGCTHLETVQFGSGLKVIGSECFRGDIALTEIALPDTIKIIGEAAFEGCRLLSKLDLSACNGGNGCTISKFAFYNCVSLTEVSMNGPKTIIKKIEDGAFAVPSGGAELNITLPATATDLGDHLFAGRANLKSVTFPSEFGTGVSASIPNSMFHGCYNLEYVVFPTDNDRFACGYVEYNPKKLFADVSNENFYVRGPELKRLGEDAEPRKCTWDAITWINDYVPYVFKNEQGIDCYEVAIDGYRFQANEKNELTSCVLVSATDGNLVIPKNVGQYDIKSIVPGCFGTGPIYSDEAERLRESIKTITISDNTVSEIGANVFESLHNLTKVTIGNSVTSIGASAFEGCENLTEVTFNSPIGGAESFPKENIGDKAFATTGTNLTFNGDIADNYGPYAWAMAPENVLDENSGLRVCYRSLAPYFITVIYDYDTEYRTMIDYPKFEQVDKYLEEAHRAEYTKLGYSSYAEMMEETNYATYQGPEWNENRRAFREAWNAATDKNSVYNSDIYGPWVNRYFVQHFDDPNNNNGVEPAVSEPQPDISDNVENTAKGKGMFDWLFEPIVVSAAEIGSTPDEYYVHFPYSAQNNSDYNRGITAEESDLISATKNIVVPSGVDSIDVYTYVNGREGYNQELLGKNKNNVLQYLSVAKVGSKSYHMYLDNYSDDSEIISGLFSGDYDDYDNNNDRFKDLELLSKGNDRVETVTLNDVTYLPDYAFDSCENLRLVNLGSKCKDIGIAPFRGCTSLTTVGGNAYYTEDNAIVYSVKPDGTYKIEECLATRGNKKGEPNITVLTDPNLALVSEINDGAFEDCLDIASVDLESATNLKEIPERCFMGCENLNYVYLPDSVNEIKKDAFVFETPKKSIYVSIPGKEVQIATDAFEPKGKNITIETYEDTSAYRYAKYYDLTIKTRGNNWPVTFFDIDGTLVYETTVTNGSSLSLAQIPEGPDRTGQGLVFKEWIGSMGAERITTHDLITGRATFLAQYESTGGMVNGKYAIDFYTSFGDKLRDTYYVEPGADIPEEEIPDPKVYEGYTFDRWTPDTFTNIQQSTTYIAGYVDNSSGNGSGGGDGNGGGTGDGSGGSGAGGSGSSTTTPLGSSTSTTSSSSASGKYTVTVINGSGSGTYEVGSTVIVAANTPATGKVFSKWTTDSESVKLASVSMAATTFVMPASNVTVTANFIDGSAVNSVSGTVNNGTTTGRNPVTGNGSTRVDITKPGISNKDLATANVNGSPDNFVVKISETNEATQAVINALTNKYGNMDSILYYAMDISLYDSTGTVKITDTTGLSVDITIPIPDALTVFGGNNMAGAVIANSQLEDLSERFTTINGVPCISFTATHFSPYTIYVNTQNLSEGMLDITPKTGDPIHPKWFLSLGLACLSVILFMKKDKKPVAVKAA